MEYGLLGENLSHSYSKIIHEKFGMYKYNLHSVSLCELKNIVKSKKFRGLNVTIPYKKVVLPYCDKLDSIAKKIGSVNTLIVNEKGLLIGYNTDYLGLKYTIERSKICLKNKKVVILGDGGTSATAKVLAEDMCAREVLIVSLFTDLNYKTIYNHLNADVVINTTPVGMYPNNGETLIDLGRFNNLSGVVDVIYNPFYTELLFEAKKYNIPTAGGLPMLVAQAKASCELFKSIKLDNSLIEKVIKNLILELSNIVLIGMPGSGKTTLATLLSKKLDKKFIDTDEAIETSFSTKIPKIFKDLGENKFRKIESNFLSDFGKKNCLILSTGGGAVLDSTNYRYLKQNGRVYWIKRDLDMLDVRGRPLSKNLDNIKKMYHIRAPLYEKFSDNAIENNGNLNSAVEQILEDFYANTCY